MHAINPSEALLKCGLHEQPDSYFSVDFYCPSWVYYMQHTPVAYTFFCSSVSPVLQDNVCIEPQRHLSMMKHSVVRWPVKEVRHAEPRIVCNDSGVWIVPLALAIADSSTYNALQCHFRVACHQCNFRCLGLDMPLAKLVQGTLFARLCLL